MSTLGSFRTGRRRMLWLGTATLALITILGAVARTAAGDGAAPAVAAIYGAGVFAIAWLTEKVTEYPRWAWHAAAGVLALALAITAVSFPAPAQVKTWTSTAWMMPWLFLVFALTPGPAAGRCSPRSSWSGLTFLGMSVVYAAILVVACWLTN